MPRTAEVVHRGDDLLGEGPVWDDRTARLYRVDTVAGAVLSLDVASGAEHRWDVGQPVGCLALRADGAGVVLAVADGFAALHPATGSTAPIAGLDHDPRAMQLNDGGCDPAGRFWAGSIRRDAQPGSGVLYRLDPPDRAVPVVTGLGVSNGLAWDADGTTLFFVDSLERRVDRFDYDPASGSLARRRPAFAVDAFPGIPDGMEIDADGCLWIAFWRGGVVRHFTPAGRLLDEVTVPVERTTSCCLGGPDLRTLFVTTARRSLRSDELDDDPAAGAVFAVDVATPGVPTARFVASTAS